MRHWLLAVLTAFATAAFAAGVVPTSDTQAVQPLAAVARYDLPAVDRPAALAEDDLRAAQDLPPRFALPAAVDLSPETSGTWEALADGETLLWRLRATAPGALSLNLTCDRFHLPKGARLVLYPAAGGRETAREFTAFDNREDDQLWTPVVLGDDLVIELTLPVAARHDYALHIASINVGYRCFGEPAEKSGACNVDVVCPEGDGWRDQIDANGVYTIGGTWICSGSLVNNTAQNGAPYFLTANHCGVNAGNAASLVVYWNFQSPTCGQHGGGSLADFQSGAIFRATYATSDFCLVELEEMPSPASHVTYAGWDRTGADAQQAVCIHHPSTDEKSISFEYQPTTVTTYLGSAVPGNGTHIRIADWDLGTTEPGSSGSPLYDQNHRVIGQLHGGYAACGNNLSDWFGRFSVSWAGGGASSNRLSNWLDPLGSAPATLDLYDPDASGLRVLPSGGLVAQGPVGGPFAPASQVYTLENNGATPLTFQVTDDASWLTISGAGGVLPPHGAAQVTVAIGPAASNLPAGVYDGTITFTNVTDGDGNTVRPARLQVGSPQVVFSFPLNSNPGWTTQGQWAFGDPQGLGGEHGDPDPNTGYTGSNVYGYNLAGDYTNTMPEYHLTTGALDCSAWQAVSVRFRRWLGVEQPGYDHAYFRASHDGVNWTTVWENEGEINDNGWQLVEYDLSAIADGQPTVYLRWTMGTTDSSYIFCGWNLDDIEVLGLPAGGTPVADAPTARTALTSATPNPFNPSTEVRFELAAAGPARLEVLDARGRLVRVLVDAPLAAGPQRAVWNGTDDAGRRVGSGVYVLRLASAGTVAFDKVLLVK
jgi:hypothetical protein